MQSLSHVIRVCLVLDFKLVQGGCASVQCHSNRFDHSNLVQLCFNAIWAGLILGSKLLEAGSVLFQFRSKFLHYRIYVNIICDVLRSYFFELGRIQFSTTGTCISFDWMLFQSVWYSVSTCLNRFESDSDKLTRN